MKRFKVLFMREFLGYFRSPVAYVFIVIFLLASVGCTFFIGKLYDSNQASLMPFFTFLPWLFLVLIPAVGMRLWAEERHSGSIELLVTLPIDLKQAVLAKFAAGWLFITIALLLTFTLPLSVAYLGDPDWGVIFGSYFGGILLAGAFLGVACMMSAATKNQVIAFILGVVVCFFLVLVGWGLFSDLLASFLPVALVNAIANLGVMPHFTSIIRGVLDSRDVIYFLTLIGVSLYLNTMIIDLKKADS